MSSNGEPSGADILRRTRLIVEYDDGRTEEARPKFVHWHEADSDLMTAQQKTHKAAWVALGKPGGDFMQWLEGVAWIDEKNDVVPPTNAKTRKGSSV